MNRTFFISNFGCRASQSEGASIHQELLESDAIEADSAYDASVVVVNSCTVTDEADRQVRQLIRRVASRNPSARIIVTGCYAQRAPEELAALPQVRCVVGNSHKPMVGQIARNLFAEDFGNHGRGEILCSSIFLERQLKPASHLGSGGRTRAVLKIQDGCNAHCSFCIIPAVRGGSRSMEVESALQELRDLVSRGYKEVVFSGIHLGTYGRDLAQRTSLHELLCRALEIPGLERLRLSSIEPMELVSEIIDLVTDRPRMAHHFHVPLQSGSARILRAMRRPYSPEYYADLVERIRHRVPDAAIGADVMVGFPGETDDDFSATYRLIEDSPLTYLHVFPFSVRPGTVAAGLPHQIPEHVSRFRAKALRSLIAHQNQEFRRKMIGREIDVLTLEAGSAISSNFVRVAVPADWPLNEWIRVRVTNLNQDGVQAARANFFNAVESSSRSTGF
ncbi:MAG: tRNA (N(6)-L-threonylcarbamoyladenosine(37)-C(2))-methylthiotransferase MtaB [Acidobacteria bacterium]|nr:MAG: tRNA (N(6)-L-threonylcarbamoyladenosine(37)-C(2))-methylthiotransferase MtaB [Acidobacteriota bacterium]